LSTSFAQDPAITIAAASDLSPAFKDLSDSFLREKKIRTQWIPGSSGTLARQIRGGAPYDAFLSANEAFARDLAASGRILPGSLRHYATGRLALFAKRTQLRSLDALSGPEVRFLAIANPGHAPYGIAAREALQKLGLWSRLQSKLVYGESVLQTLQLATSGNADAALVAWSQVLSSGGLLLDENLHAPIRQAGGALTPRGRSLLDWIVSPSAQAILARYGFGPGTPP
jgi:molybdate transport system substrate-binding protein